MRQKQGQLTESLYLRVTREEKAWLQQRAIALKLQPAQYARMLLSKAVDFDKQEPGKVFTGYL
jgi:hypothetical protein